MSEDSRIIHCRDQETITTKPMTLCGQSIARLRPWNWASQFIFKSIVVLDSERCPECSAKLRERPEPRQPIFTRREDE